MWEIAAISIASAMAEQRLLERMTPEQRKEHERAKEEQRRFDEAVNRVVKSAMDNYQPPYRSYSSTCHHSSKMGLSGSSFVLGLILGGNL